MFAEDTERIIPKKQPYRWAQYLFQGIFSLVFLTYFIILPYFVPDQGGIYALGDNIFFWVVMVGYFALSMGILIFEGWQVRRNWASLAEEMGFRYEPRTGSKYSSIQGSYRSHRFEITQRAERQGRSQVFFTDYTIPLNTPVRNTLAIQPKAITHFNRELTGDEEVDRKLTVSASSKQLLQYLLRTRRIRLGLMQLAERNRGLQITMDKRTLRLSMRGRPANKEYLVAVLALLVELAGAVERQDQMAS